MSVGDAPLLTTAEATGYRRTSTHAEVCAFVRRLARGNPWVRVTSMGRSGLGQPMPVMVVSPDGAFTPRAAYRRGLLKLLVIANIHAGEVEGKEAVCMLARDLTRKQPPKWLHGTVLILIPNYNPDGNDRISVKNRALDLEKLDGQIGPEGGVGTRYTGRGVNLNRDYMKQEAVETRNLSRLFGDWWPHLTVDCHTTDGSLHRYDLTYDTAHTVASVGHWEPIRWVQDRFLPALSRRLATVHRIPTFFYGNYRDQTDPSKGWETYSPLPRYGSHYRGLTGRMDVLLETYSYIPFHKRVGVMYATLRELFRLAAAKRRRIQTITARAERAAIEGGPGAGIAYGVPMRGSDGALRFRYPAHPLRRPVKILGWDRATLRARRLEGGRPQTWRAQHFAIFEPTKGVDRPFAYVVPAALERRLADHNIVVERLRRPVTCEVERYVVLDLQETESPDVGTRARTETVVSVRSERVPRRLPAGTRIVRMAQPLARLAIYLLEPESDDGFARWGLLGRDVRVGREFPVARLNDPVRLVTARLR